MYNTRASEAGYSVEKMSSYRADLVASEAATDATLIKSEWNDFDYVVTANALHHFEDPSLATRRLVERLKPGGVFLITDGVPGPVESSQDVWEGKVPPPADGHHHHGHGHSHHGQGGRDKNHGQNQVSKSEKGEDFGIAHTGFTKTFVEDLLKDIGCENVDTALLDSTMKMPASIGGGEKRIFLARGTKSAVEG